MLYLEFFPQHFRQGLFHLGFNSFLVLFSTFLTLWSFSIFIHATPSIYCNELGEGGLFVSITFSFLLYV
jgi:hypothetical protein